MSWFRTKPKQLPSFGDVAPDGLYDLHAHVLPSLDDGARSIEESCVVLDALEWIGFAVVSSTPHFDCETGQPSREVQQRAIDTLTEARGARLPRVVTGSETVFNEAFLEGVARSAVPGIGGLAVYLVEFGFLPSSVPLGIEEIVFRFHMKEQQLVLAHPERIPDIQRDLGKASALRRAGMLFQMDVMSLVGKYGRRARRTALEMLEQGMIDLVSTDLHRSDDLDTLAGAMTALYEYDEHVFVQLFSTHPRLVHENRVDEIVQDA